MAVQALYRKWRPQTFDDVVGQEHVIRTLRNALTSERIHHAYLFAGPRGTGKTTIAVNLAQTAAGLGQKIQYLDCDVEEPNGHIFLKPGIEKRLVVTVEMPEVDLKQCTGCRLSEHLGANRA